MTRTDRFALAARAVAVAVAVAGVASLVATALPAQAQDRATIDPTQVIGNRELPKVLYIVPWKKPLPGELTGRPPTSVIDEALAPIDRDVFRRQVQYDAMERAHAAAANASPGAATAQPAAR